MNKLSTEKRVTILRCLIAVPQQQPAEPEDGQIRLVSDGAEYPNRERVGRYVTVLSDHG